MSPPVLHGGGITTSCCMGGFGGFWDPPTLVPSYVSPSEQRAWGAMEGGELGGVGGKVPGGD